MRDLHNNLDGVAALTPRSVGANGTINGSGVDLQGYDSVEFVVAAGTITDGTHAVNVQDSDDDITYAEAAAGDILGAEPSFAATDDNAVKQVGYVGPKRYCRIQLVSTGVTTGGLFGAVATKGRERHAGGQAV